MAENTETVFRKKTLDRISSPEQITDYLRVTNPGIWDAASRILVLDGGRIVEDGTYDDLIDKGGFFAELVKRQRLDTAG